MTPRAGQGRQAGQGARLQVQSMCVRHTLQYSRVLLDVLDLTDNSKAQTSSAVRCSDEAELNHQLRAARQS